MTMQKGLLGHRYDDSEPLYLTTSGDLIWNRLTKKWINFASLDAKRVAEGADWANREIGVPSVAWQQSHARMNFGWGPGLDDTSGLASELVVNGEDWVGATGVTPPTSWTEVGDLTFALATGVLTMTNVSGNGWISQSMTTVVGTRYVFEVKFGPATTPGAKIQLGGIDFVYGAGGASVVGFGFTAVSEATILNVVLNGAGVIEVDHMRFYLEAELTGSGGALGGGIQQDVFGPFMSGTLEYFIRKSDCMIGFDITDNSVPDAWVNWAAVAVSSIDEQHKLDIAMELEDYGCSAPMPAADEPEKPVKKKKKEKS